MTSRRLRLFGTIIAAMLHTAALQATTTIVATPANVVLTYQKGTGPGAAVPVKIAPSTGTTGTIYWTVNTSTLPTWLVLDKNNGTAGTATASTVNFSAGAFAASLGAGTYTATVGLQSTSLADSTIAVTLTVKSAPAQIAATLTTIPTWTPGDVLPANIKLSVKSVGDPQNFTITTTATNPATPWFSLAATSGIVYSWGTDIDVTFTKSAFDNATIGKPLAGTIIVKGPNNTATVIVSITIGAPAVTVTAVLPPKLPKVASGTGTRTISVTGTGFADGMAVKLNTGTTAIANNCVTFNTATVNAVCVQGPTRFFLKLTEATDLKAGTDITLHVADQTFTIPVTTNPIVYSVTNSASFEQVASGNQRVSPYEMITIFGDNFMKLGDIAYGAIASGRYPKKLTDSLTTDLSVHFQKASDNSDLAADTDGYLLFGTSTQINLLVPSSLPTAVAGGELEAIVKYGTSSSDVVTLDVKAAHPGMFAYVATGQAIAVNADGTVNSSTNPAKLGASPTYLTLYVSGMGNPHDGTSLVGAGASAAVPGGCVDITKSLLAADPWLTLDGGIIDATTMVGLNTLPPCFAPSGLNVRIGGALFTGASLNYAGWVAGSVAGLDQINVVLPATPLSGMTPTTTGGSGYSASVTISNQSSPAAVVYIK